MTSRQLLIPVLLKDEDVLSFNYDELDPLFKSEKTEDFAPIIHCVVGKDRALAVQFCCDLYNSISEGNNGGTNLDATSIMDALGQMEKNNEDASQLSILSSPIVSQSEKTVHLFLFLWASEGSKIVSDEFVACVGVALSMASNVVFDWPSRFSREDTLWLEKILVVMLNLKKVDAIQATSFLYRDWSNGSGVSIGLQENASMAPAPFGNFTSFQQKNEGNPLFPSSVVFLAPPPAIVGKESAPVKRLMRTFLNNLMERSRPKTNVLTMPEFYDTLQSPIFLSEVLEMDIDVVQSMLVGDRETESSNSNLEAWATPKEGQSETEESNDEDSDSESSVSSSDGKMKEEETSLPEVEEKSRDPEESENPFNIEFDFDWGIPDTPVVNKSLIISTPKKNTSPSNSSIANDSGFTETLSFNQSVSSPCSSRFEKDKAAVTTQSPQSTFSSFLTRDTEDGLVARKLQFSTPKKVEHEDQATDPMDMIRQILKTSTASTNDIQEEEKYDGNVEIPVPPTSMSNYDDNIVKPTYVKTNCFVTKTKADKQAPYEEPGSGSKRQVGTLSPVVFENSNARDECNAFQALLNRFDVQSLHAQTSIGNCDESFVKPTYVETNFFVPKSKADKQALHEEPGSGSKRQVDVLSPPLFENANTRDKCKAFQPLLNTFDVPRLHVPTSINNYDDDDNIVKPTYVETNSFVTKRKADKQALYEEPGSGSKRQVDALSTPLFENSNARDECNAFQPLLNTFHLQSLYEQTSINVYDDSFVKPTYVETNFFVEKSNECKGTDKQSLHDEEPGSKRQIDTPLFENASDKGKAIQPLNTFDVSTLKTTPMYLWEAKETSNNVTKSDPSNASKIKEDQVVLSSQNDNSPKSLGVGKSKVAGFEGQKENCLPVPSTAKPRVDNCSKTRQGRADQEKALSSLDPISKHVPAALMKEAEESTSISAAGSIDVQTINVIVHFGLTHLAAFNANSGKEIVTTKNEVKYLNKELGRHHGQVEQSKSNFKAAKLAKLIKPSSEGDTELQNSISHGVGSILRVMHQTIIQALSYATKLVEIRYVILFPSLGRVVLDEIFQRAVQISGIQANLFRDVIGLFTFALGYTKQTWGRPVIVIQNYEPFKFCTLETYVFNHSTNKYEIVRKDTSQKETKGVFKLMGKRSLGAGEYEKPVTAIVFQTSINKTAVELALEAKIFNVDKSHCFLILCDVIMNECNSKKIRKHYPQQVSGTSLFTSSSSDIAKNALTSGGLHLQDSNPLPNFEGLWELSKMRSTQVTEI